MLRITTTSTVFILLSSAASADYIGMTAELVGQNLLQDTDTPNYTIRVYAQVDAGSRINGVYGDSDDTLFVTPAMGTSFYQDPFGGPTSQSINSNFFPLEPNLEWDSYVTIGSLDNSGYPFQDNALMDIGIDWNSFESGQEITTDNGIWFITPDDPQGQESNGQVLIAQLTVLTPFNEYTPPSIGAKFVGHNADGSSWIAWGEYHWIPAPATMALLPGLLLVGTRRRS